MYGITYTWTLKKSKKAYFIETKNRMVVPRDGVGEGEIGCAGQGVQIFSYKEKKFWESNIQHGDCS